jgi:aminoglycoside 2'-N-acetyltransferase I
VSFIEIFTTDEAAPGRLAEIRDLLAVAFDGTWTVDDWDHTLGGVHVVALTKGAMLSHAAVVPRTLEVAGRTLAAGYVEAVATHPEHERRGHGSAVMTEINQIIRETHEMGALSTGHHVFYERLGWERWHGPTYIRSGDELTRSAEEDDGIMVLRFGPSTGIDLTTPITCEARSGDDW